MESILNRAEQSFRQGPASFLKRTIVNIPDFSVCGCNDMIINAAASADSIQYQLRLFPEGEKDRKL
jgi:hypothetical protein